MKQIFKVKIQNKMTCDCYKLSFKYLCSKFVVWYIVKKSIATLKMSSNKSTFYVILCTTTQTIMEMLSVGNQEQTKYTYSVFKSNKTKTLIQYVNYPKTMTKEQRRVRKRCQKQPHLNLGFE